MGSAQSTPDDGITNRVISVPSITVPKALFKPLPKVDFKDLAAMAKTLPDAVKAAAHNEVELAKHIQELSGEVAELQKQLRGLLELQQHISAAHRMYASRLEAISSLTQAKDRDQLVTSQTAALASRIGLGKALAK